ncbi:MAG: hypothetical protein ABSF58_14640 [Solirubrobacteraceae bacterium]|jgi:hypothetical protein
MADAERQLAVEGAQRVRVAACALTAGLFFFGGQLWVAVVGGKEPTIGILQGLRPALHGLAVAAVDPRTVHEQFLVSHQGPLIASFLISNIGALGMLVPLRYLASAEMARSPSPSRIASQLALFGPILLAVFLPAFEISLIIGAHSYLSHSARDAAAITAATAGGLRVAFQLILTVGTLALAAAFIMISLRSMRVGLLTRLMGIVGIIAGVLFLIPLTPLPVIQSLWLVFFAAMLLQFGGRPLPEAWTVVEARPWPVRERAPRQQRQQRQPMRGLRRGSSDSSPVPAPVAPSGPSPSASKKRKRRR